MTRDGGAVAWRRKSENLDGGSGTVAATPLDGADVHVLAVDDSLIDRKVIERLLKITSCKVTAVDSGRRALQFLGLDEEKSNTVVDVDLKVDLVITDYCMPGMTGYELLKKIKESSALKQIPVVIMSSENVLTRIDRCLEEGAEEFIVKPVKLADVKRLKDFMMRDFQVKNSNKRKLRDDSDLDLVSPPPPSPSPSTSPPPPQSLSTSPSASLSTSPSISPPPSLSTSPSSSSSISASPPSSPSMHTCSPPPSTPPPQQQPVEIPS